ncbi:hypothetical protein IHE45_07G058900 [Dioscorea alata]|uniref:Uncharacterized protein n=1 Tax=Dioscorea alata TaxID=55571 RepID=A0ACB7VRU1_DIOAL|nr:hypothetical protein IHE45_07G058900 [Dioscorea alata]
MLLALQAQCTLSRRRASSPDPSASSPLASNTSLYFIGFGSFSWTPIGMSSHGGWKTKALHSIFFRPSHASVSSLEEERKCNHGESFKVQIHVELDLGGKMSFFYSNPCFFGFFCSYFVWICGIYDCYLEIWQ